MVLLGRVGSNPTPGANLLDPPSGCHACAYRRNEDCCQRRTLSEPHPTFFTQMGIIVVDRSVAGCACIELVDGRSLIRDWLPPPLWHQLRAGFCFLFSLLLVQPLEQAAPANGSSSSGNASQMIMPRYAPYQPTLVFAGTFKGLSNGSETLYRNLSVVRAYMDTSVTGGVTYYYYVTAFNAFGESAPSNRAVVELSASNLTLPFNLVTGVPGTIAVAAILLVIFLLRRRSKNLSLQPDH